ncbi:MAG: DoxX family protein [Bdellovibrionaceae bacterium]|nr:DoxX family protein [Pseudobdellovibrionaceae bacterium]
MNISEILQIIIALGLINVWLFRNSKSTDYRGGSAKNLKQEFAAYGLPSWVYYVVGSLKMGSALALILGLHHSSVTLTASVIIAVLMVGALCMHIKVKDHFKKSVPALVMLIMSLFVAYTNFHQGIN